MVETRAQVFCPILFAAHFLAAKLEAVQYKMAQKLKEIQKARGDAGSSDTGMGQFERHDTVVAQNSAPLVTTQSALRGSVEQFSALIVPPEVRQDGNEKGDTSRYGVRLMIIWRLTAAL